MRAPDAALTAELVAFDALRDELGDQASVAGPWLGTLRRQWRAASAESSIEIEGFHVPEDETLAVATDNEPSDPTDEDRMALSCYARASSLLATCAATSIEQLLDPSDPLDTVVRRPVVRRSSPGLRTYGPVDFF
jgi:hypothetical protein